MAEAQRNGHPVVVVGYDGSAPSRAAVDYAAHRAGPDGTVFVVHAYAPPSDWLGHPNYQHVLEDHMSRGRAVLDALVLEDDALLETSFETELIGEPAPDAIVAVAEARGADEVVVGSRGHGRVRSVLGSVSSEVIHRSHVPVVVLPAQSEARDG